MSKIIEETAKLELAQEVSDVINKYVSLVNACDIIQVLEVAKLTVFQKMMEG